MSIEKIKKEIRMEFLNSKTVKEAENRMLKVFWTNFRRNKRRYPHNYSKEEVISVMQYISTINLRTASHLDSSKVKSNRVLREEYDVKKESDSWKTHINSETCYVCDNKANVRHHIIPLSMGGKNSYKNIRALCRKCHEKIHKWLRN